jgi:16S rRNA (adenine1518-N6/adenine1519-N6)-dimethyltransferase
MTANTRQTQSFLRNLFQERGLQPKNKLGQNFLIDLNLLEVLLRQADLSREDLVLEVGTGTGSLTAQLANHAGAVLSVEIDHHFFQLASETLGHRPHLRLVSLKTKTTSIPRCWNWSPRPGPAGNSKG